MYVLIPPLSLLACLKLKKTNFYSLSKLILSKLLHYSISITSISITSVFKKENVHGMKQDVHRSIKLVKLDSDYKYSDKKQINNR